MGATVHITGDEKYDKSVVLYTNSINDKVKKFKYRNMSFENLSSNVGLDEMAHTIQGHDSLLADGTWKNPRPYEKYNLQLQANVYAYIWYKQLHSNNEPPIEMYEKHTINKWRDDECNLKEDSKFVKQKKEYLKLEKKLEDKTLSDTARENIVKDLGKVADWFDEILPPIKFNGVYDSGADLGCTEKDKKP
ncbi:MAG: hypothetical protein F4Z01_04990 [Gammaproteobacteria bacterium]|nr:hypothetical protein [Gammaproteobacteria bacterium]